MIAQKTDARNEIRFLCIEELVPEEHLLRKACYERRKETIERVFADAKEKHAMRYTHMRGLTRVRNWVGLKLAALNLKKLATWNAKSFLHSPFHFLSRLLDVFYPLPLIRQGVL